MAKLVLGTDKNNTGTSSVVVEKPVPMPYSKVYRNVNGKLEAPNTFMDLTGINDIGDYGLYYAYCSSSCVPENLDLSGLTTISGYYGAGYSFYGCSSIRTIDLSNLRSITGQYGCYYMFYGCSNLTSVDFTNLESIDGFTNTFDMFFGCSNLTSVSFPKIVELTNNSMFNNTFNRCSRLKTADFSNLERITGASGFNQCFVRCTSLTSVNFDSLSLMNTTSWGAFQGCFENCTSLKTLSFPSLTSNSFGTKTDQFNNMLRYVTGCTIHFPSNLESVIQTLQTYPNFGGTDTILLFDLPATE